MSIRSLVLLASVFTLAYQSQAFAGPRSASTKEAVEYLSACGNFVRVDDENVYTGFGLYWTSAVQPRQPKPSILRFVPIDKITEYQVDTLDSVVDVAKHGASTYVLTYSGIEEWDLTKYQRLATYGTHPMRRPLGDEEHPKAFAKYKNKLVIAHGRLGVSFFDLETKTLGKTLALASSRLPLQSVANGVTVAGRYAYVVLDSYTLVGPREKPAFRGLAVVDLETETVISELDGMDPGADSIASDDKVAIVSFHGQPLWKYSHSLATASSLPAPLKRVWKFPIEGHPVGKAAMDDTYYYTCFSRMPREGEGPYFIKIPAVLDRRVLMLD